MLSLAMLSYRGFWNARSDNRGAIAESIAAGLQDLPPLKGDWALVWGPGTYRYLGSVFDGSLMYVVRSTRHPARYAIVVRGTNPADLFDWILGDFLSHRQIPWHPVDVQDETEARVSLSTALGLKILLGMRAQVHTEAMSDILGHEDLLTAQREGMQPAVDEAGNSSRARRSAPVLGLASRMLRYQRLWTLAERIGSGVGEVIQMESVLRMRSLRRRMISTLDRSLENVVDVPDALLQPGLGELSADEAPGLNILEFLRLLADAHGDSLELFVTGHSKGGALAPTLALFLDDTQRCDEQEVRWVYRWNPRSRAAISCYAYAGPTPGNRAFAAHFNRQLGPCFYRYANKLDFVTLAWDGDALRTAGDLYAGVVEPLPALEVLLEEISNEIEGLDYCHPGQDYAPGGQQVEKHVVEFSGPLQEDNRSLFLQEIYQHMDAYLVLLGLDRLVSVEDFLGGRSFPGRKK